MATNPIRFVKIVIIILLMIMILIRVFSCIVFVVANQYYGINKSNKIVCSLVYVCNTGSVSRSNSYLDIHIIYNNIQQYNCLIINELIKIFYREIPIV